MKAYIFYARVHQYGGIERNILALAQSVSVNGLTPVLICFEDKVDLHRESGGVLQVKVIGTDNILMRIWRIRKVVTESAGLVVCFGVWGGAFLSITGLGYLLHYTDPPSVMPEIVSWERRIRFRLLAGAAIRRAESCITMTKRNAKELAEKFGRTFEVIYQGGVPPPSWVKKSRDDKILRLVSVCRLTTSKNLDWAIALHHRCCEDAGLREKYDRVELVLIGEGPEDGNLKKLAATTCSNDSIHILGFCSNDAIEKIMATAHVAVVPGVQGYGLPVIEALYRGLYVLLNDASGVSEILANNARVCITRNCKEDFVKKGVNVLSSLDMNFVSDAHASMDVTLPTEASWAQALGKSAHWW